MKRATLLFASLFCLCLGGYAQTTATLQSKPTATAPAGDDWLLLQGPTHGQRKLAPAYYQPADASLLAYAQAVDAAARRDLIGAAAATHTHTLSALTQSGATTGQVATWNGSTWAPATPSAAGGTGDMLRSTYDANTDGVIDAAALPNSWASLTITGSLNVPAGAVSDAAIATTIARDSEVTAAVAAETSARGTAITAAIAQEVTDRNTAIAAAVGSVSAGSLPVGARCDMLTTVTPPSTFLLANGTNGTPDLLSSTEGTGTYPYFQGRGTAATPTAGVAPGTYTSAQTVSLSTTSTPSTTIRYTTNGDTVTPTSNVYSEPLSVATTQTIRARTYGTLWSPSEEFSGVYTINIPASGFSWTMESLTATGSGDTSATLTGATLSSAQAQAGTQSLYCSGAAWQYAEFTTGATANADLNLQEGTMSFYIRWTGTWAASPFLASLQANSGSARIAVIAQATQGQIQLAYRGSNNSSTTLLATGLTNPDTWYLVTVKWRQTSSPYLSIQFDNGTAKTSPNVLASVAEASAKILVGNYSATGSSTAFYIDNLTVSTTWQ